jgi:DHA1 family bicyclomycin/chloramphenicol resistance-like MFS transporter
MKNNTTNKSLIVLILGLLMTVTPFAIDMYLTSFFQIAKDLGTAPSQLPLTVTSYFVGLAIGQLLYGPLLDRFGRKIPLYFGLLVYILSCIGCIESRTLEVMIAFRLIQALGGCVAGVAAVAMVRDFFPVEETAKILSMLFLILGVSPLLAPTFGGFIAAIWGWQSIFLVLIGLVLLITSLVFFVLPDGNQPDRTVSLKPKAFVESYFSILKNRRFFTYAFSGSLSFTTLLLYVGGSPVIFMGVFHVNPQIYGAIFALLSVGFIGSNQLNIVLLRRFTSEQLMSWALTGQVVASVVFLVGACNGWYGMPMTIVFFFLCLSFLGLINPNASALALAPFSTNAGSASALMGFLQIGLSALATSALALFNLTNSVPVAAIMTATSALALAILVGSTVLPLARKKFKREPTGS